jgi:MFS family permease
MIGASAIFIFGSGLCGGASSMDMLIWGRAVQGIGAGGINMLIDMIICDLVPMRERGNFIGLLFLFVTMGTTVGPTIGGVMTEHASWRWVFYINLPLGGIAILLLILFLQVK